jgi:FMN phosphatase YigB (HAD superfamily)
MTMPKLICFDIGGVLVRLNPGFSSELISLAAPHEVQNLREVLRDDFTHNQAGYSASEKYQLGQLASDEFVSLVSSALGGRLTKDLITTKLMAEIAGEIPETTKLLAPLARVARLGCFSNTNAIHWDFLNDTFSWMTTFEIKLASHLCGFAKPDAAAFEAVCDAALIKPNEGLFIDDRQINVDGARRIGMSAILYSNPPRLIDDLREHEVRIEIERPRAL